jgi:NAD(P)H-dependent FMN reductase
MNKLNIKLIVGSTRANRFSEKPAQWIHDLAAARPEIELERLDLRDYPLPFFEEPLPPGFARDNYTNPAIIRWREKVREADGFIICTPEYNHGYPAILKNALDTVYHAWSRKAVAFVSWGGAGGTRGVEQLRLVTIELDMAPIALLVHIPRAVVHQGDCQIDTEQNRGNAASLLDNLICGTAPSKRRASAPRERHSMPRTRSTTTRAASSRARARRPRRRAPRSRAPTAESPPRGSRSTLAGRIPQDVADARSHRA